MPAYDADVSKRIFLHVGSPKTGTTYLQEVLWSHEKQLRKQGILLPGKGIEDHFRACIDVRQDGHKVLDPERVAGAWDRLVDQMSSWDGDSIVSHELFAPATAEQAEQAVAKLGDAEVHVVVTARDLSRQIPAEWQEHIKHRSTLTFPEFVGAVRHQRPAARWFWRVQDTADVLDRWGHALPRDQVHVITVPVAGSGMGELWKRFAGLVGVDDSDFDLATARSNTSLRAEQTELLRRLNAQLGDRLPFPGTYPPVVKSFLAHRVLSGRAGTRFGLVGGDADYAIQRSKEMVDQLQRLGVIVTGDLQELIPSDEPEPEISGDAQVSSEAVLEEAVESLIQVLNEYAQDRARVRVSRPGLPEGKQTFENVKAERDQLLHDVQYRPIRHLLIGQSMRRHWLWKLRTGYWRAVNVPFGHFRRSRDRTG